MNSSGPEWGGRPRLSDGQQGRRSCSKRNTSSEERSSRTETVPARAWEDVQSASAAHSREYGKETQQGVFDGKVVGSCFSPKCPDDCVSAKRSVVLAVVAQAAAFFVLGQSLSLIYLCSHLGHRSRGRSGRAISGVSNLSKHRTASADA